jgi:uncharacterized protein YjbJ (UPF0337 family)
MSDDRIEGDWKQARGWLKEQWGRLTDDDLTVIDGQIDQLVGRLQERYGYAEEQARREVREFQAYRAYKRP